MTGYPFRCHESNSNKILRSEAFLPRGATLVLGMLKTLGPARDLGFSLCVRPAMVSSCGCNHVERSLGWSMPVVLFATAPRSVPNRAHGANFEQ